MAGQLWSVNNLGGFMFSEELSDVLRTALQPLTRFRNFCDIEDGKEAGRGENWNWNVYNDVATAGGSLNEEEAMPETNFTITQESLTVTEYGNSVPYTKKADLFSKHSMERVIHKVLKNDARKALDSAAHAQFDATVWTVQPSSGSSNTAVQFATNGAFANTTTVEMQKEHVQLIADELAENDVTPYDGEHYMCIARPGTYRTFRQDLEAISFYVESGFREIKAGELGRYEGIRFFSQTNIASEGYASATDQAYFFGADAVTEAIVEPEQIRAKLPGDYGRSRGIAWYYVGGFGLCHTAAANSRVMKWGSSS